MGSDSPRCHLYCILWRLVSYLSAFYSFGSVFLLSVTRVSYLPLIILSLCQHSRNLFHVLFFECYTASHAIKDACVTDRMCMNVKLQTFQTFYLINRCTFVIVYKMGMQLNFIFLCNESPKLNS